LQLARRRDILADHSALPPRLPRVEVDMRRETSTRKPPHQADVGVVRAGIPPTPALSFDLLVKAISQVDAELAAQAGRAVNMSLTMRNWLIGLHIAEYEQGGKDRAQYGDRLLARLSDRLTSAGVSRAEERELRRYRQFYLAYPQIRESLTPEFRARILGGLASSPPGIRETVSPESRGSTMDLLCQLSFSHIVELLKCGTAAQRLFYETECLSGDWSVRELRRQIGSLYYERSALSQDKARLAAEAHARAERAEPKLTIRDPYVFEFLGLRPAEVASESHLEEQLLDKLQSFLLELGKGFCFEARQKRILIGDSHYFVDLVFYHRILKCHVLVELKLAGFSHENLGQLNTYVSWFRRNAMSEGDHPPVGILLCTERDHALVEYALAGIDNEIFVSKYLLELPKKEEMQRFIEAQLRA
jgi:predicted nuclease of restriction endonuclease-like (RecB) superfamily